IYSLGVMAYEMLTGKLPFKAETAWEWATQHMTQQPIPIETMAEGMRAPEGMRAAIRRALAKSPDERFQTVREVSAAFATAAAAASGRGGTAPLVAGAPARAKTEVGAPLDVAQAFGGPPAAPMGMQGPQPSYPGPIAAPGPMPAQGYTPVGGNVAFT